VSGTRLPQKNVSDTALLIEVYLYFLRGVTLGVVPFLAAITFFTIGITIGANFTAVLTTLDTFKK